MTLRLLEQLKRHARERGHAPAYRQAITGRALTYSQLHDRVAALAMRLRQCAPPESVILLACPNTCDFPVAFLAILVAGCSAFPVSAEITDCELSTAAQKSGAVGIIAHGRTLDGIKFAIDITEIAQLKGDCEFSAGDLLLQSTGTTGQPKIVLRTGRSLDAVADNMCRSIGFTESDHVLAAVPLCHSYGLEHGLLAPLMAGSAVHLCDGFDLATVMLALEGGVTIFPGVPSMFEMLAQVGDGQKFPLLRSAYSAGGPLPRSVFDAFSQKHGIQIGQLYGATEIGSITFNDPRSPAFDPASVGRTMDGVIVRILDDNQVAIHAPSMFSGYVDSSESPLLDNFFPTGDLGRIDALGNLFITGRIKLLIDVGGLKVNPLEVETLLSQHPSVGRCVVVPLRLSATVFRLKAIVTPRDAGDPPSAESLRQFARARLTGYKVPRVFEIRDRLPTSPTGKILRHLVEAP